MPDPDPGNTDSYADGQDKVWVVRRPHSGYVFKVMVEFYDVSGLLLYRMCHYEWLCNRS